MWLIQMDARLFTTCKIFYQMDVLGYIHDAQVLFSLFGRRLLELGLHGCLDWISWVHEEGIARGWLV